MVRSGIGLLASIGLCGVVLLVSACGQDEATAPSADLEPTTTPESSPAPSEADAPRVARAEYVTSAECRGCHPSEVEAWTGSHHDRAMQEATSETVLGDFADASFERNGEAWRFFRREGAYVVNTIGADGASADFEVVHTFGVDPLQQYLVALPGGRLQSLTVAWDTRPAEAGGQRWFSLYPDETVRPDDVLHWTGIANRWNTMCAHCHSTNVRKNFDLATKTYDTTWSEIDVACEACHGPASLHVEWATSGADRSGEGGKGLTRAAGGDRDGVWVMSPESGIAYREPPRSDEAEIDTCSGCHSRRGMLSEGWEEPRFLDRFVPALLDEGLYFADGQIQDEVYVYGSFKQSRMYHAGVRCGDCHEPHSLALRAEGNTLCAQCHAPSMFAVPSHHGHVAQRLGSACVDCHMPSRTYMVIDDRRDHSFRIPRPDLTVELGIPNACNTCHSDRDAAWAANEIASWPRARGSEREHFAEALQAGRRGSLEAPRTLLELAANEDSPAIARATAVTLLARYPGTELAEAIRGGAGDVDPLMRLAAARAADSFPIGDRIGLVGRLLLDRIRAVRTEAASTLAGADPGRLGGHLTGALETALAEYRGAQALDADRPTSHVNLGLVATSIGDVAAAEAHYREALEVGPYFVPAYVNLADLLRRLGDEEQSLKVLEQGLEVVPDASELHHVRGLALVRAGRSTRALASLRRASELDPSRARYAYVLGVALYSGGAVEEALETLRAAHELHPTDVSILEGLVSISREAGHSEEAMGYLRELQSLTDDTRDGSAR